MILGWGLFSASYHTSSSSVAGRPRVWTIWLVCPMASPARWQSIDLNCIRHYILAKTLTFVCKLLDESDKEFASTLDLSGVQVDWHKFPALQWNAAQIKGTHRIIPKLIVVKVTINSHPARAMLDSGSLGDFMSSILADQLQLKQNTLTIPLTLQLAVQGSRSKLMLQCQHGWCIRVLMRHVPLMWLTSIAMT